MKKLLCLLLAVMLLVGMTGVMVSAEEPAKQAFIRVGGQNADGTPKEIGLIVDEGGAAKYLITNENGVATEEGANADNYNVKFEYPTGGPATIYLKGATLTTQDNFAALSIGTPNWYSPIVTDFDAKVVTEADSTLTGRNHRTGIAGYSAIDYMGDGTLTVTGPGKLNLYSETMCAIVTSTELFIKDANIYGEVQVKGDQRPVLWAKDSNITIDNSKVELKNGEGGACLYNSDALYEFGGEPHDIIIKNNSNLKITANSYRAAVQSTGKFIINSSDVEITAKGQCFNVVPEMEGVGALGGTKATNAKAFDAKKAKSYLFFLCGPKVVPPTTAPVETLPPVTQAPTQATQAAEGNDATQATQPTQDAQPTQATQAATKPTQAPTQATQATQGTQATQPAGGNTEEKGNGLQTIIIIAIVVIVLAGAGLAVFMIMQNKKLDAVIAGDEADATEETNEETESESEE